MAAQPIRRTCTCPAKRFLTLDSSGNLYIADTGDNTVREITTNGVITTLAGDGLPSYSGDARFVAVNAELHSPEGVAVDASGNVYIADTANGYIREITRTTGIINFIAGDGSIGYSGDGALANVAGLDEPWAIALDSASPPNVYFTEPEDGRVREITTATGKISTVAGNGVFGFSGDGSAATGAMLHLPVGLAIDSSGNLYLGDSYNNRVRKVTGTTISTIAGSGVLSYSGDGGAATSAQLNTPEAVAVDASGNVYIADTVNNVVREVTAKGVISTIVARHWNRRLRRRWRRGNFGDAQFAARRGRGCLRQRLRLRYSQSRACARFPAGPLQPLPAAPRRAMRAMAQPQPARR